jgi:hypothetical protein
LQFLETYGIKSVKKTLKAPRSEGSAIAICVATMLQKKRGRTLRKFKCGARPMLETQHLK